MKQSKNLNIQMSLNYALEFLLTLGLWLIWGRCTYEVIKDSLAGKMEEYLNANFWIFAISVGVILAVILGLYALVKNKKINLIHMTAKEKISAMSLQKVKEENTVCAFFEIDPISLWNAKSKKKIQVNFPFSDMRCELKFHE